MSPSIKPTDPPEHDCEKDGHEYSEVTDICKYCKQLNPEHEHAYPPESDRCRCGGLNPDHVHKYNAEFNCICGDKHEHAHKYDPAQKTGACAEEGCLVMCDHPETEEGQECAKCGVVKPRLHDDNNHWWNSETGKCDYEGCGAVCNHGYEDGVMPRNVRSCTICGKLNDRYHDCETVGHIWNGDTCEVCEAEYSCETYGHVWKEGVCEKCKEACEHPNVKVGEECEICHIVKPMQVHEEHAYQYNAETGKSECTVEGCHEVCKHDGMNANLDTCPKCGMPKDVYIKLIHGENDHNWQNGVCATEGCGLTCKHEGMVNNNLAKCPVCGVNNPEHKHQYNRDEPTGKCTVEGCGAECTHANATALEELCPDCGIKSPAYEDAGHDHDWREGHSKCGVENCTQECPHEGMVGGNLPECPVCCTQNEDYEAPPIHADGQHDWSKNDGVCATEGCEAVCDHGSQTEGTCGTCHKVLTAEGGEPENPCANGHDWSNHDGLCVRAGCGEKCDHAANGESNSWQTCVTCGAPNPAEVVQHVCADGNGDKVCDTCGELMDSEGSTGGGTETPDATPAPTPATPSPTPGKDDDDPDGDNPSPTPPATGGDGDGDGSGGGGGTQTPTTTPDVGFGFSEEEI